MVAEGLFVLLSIIQINNLNNTSTISQSTSEWGNEKQCERAKTLTLNYIKTSRNVDRYLVTCVEKGSVSEVEDIPLKENTSQK